jgi:type VI secretion system secreted protein VgrG
MSSAARLDVQLSCEHANLEGVVVTRLDGHEEVSRLSWFDVDLVALTSATTVDDLDGATVTLHFLENGVELRTVHGFVESITERLVIDDGEPGRGAATEGSSYAGEQPRVLSLRVVPSLAQLRLVEAQSVHLGKSVPEIVAEKLALFGMHEGTDFELRLSKTYEKREFVVQYRESDLAFVERLLEDAGIAYFFEHDGGVDKVVLSDSNTGFGEGSAPTLRFDPQGNDAIYSLVQRRRIVPRVVAVRDYNYRTPLTDVFAHRDIPEGYGGGCIDYGSHAKSPEHAAEIAKLRAEEKLATRATYEGRSAVPDLSAGTRIGVTDHPLFSGGQRLDLCVLAVDHAYRRPSALASGEPGRYENRFRALDAGVVFRPARVTPKPRVHGFLTGQIEPVPTAPGARLLPAQIDEEGRYWVRFHFDALDAAGQKPSRPIRMAQAHAGAGYGTHFPLRPGVEVVVAFLDGDPDRPVILGAVPNAVNPSPVNASRARVSEVVTASGMVMQFRDKTL